MLSVPPANLAQLVSAQQLVVGVQSANHHVHRQTSSLLGQEHATKGDRRECNKAVNLKDNRDEDWRLRQGVMSEKIFDLRKNGLDNCHCERSYCSGQGEPTCTSRVHANCQTDTGVSKREYRTIGTMSSNSLRSEDRLQTDGRFNQDGNSFCNLSSTHSSYTSSSDSSISENHSLLALSDLSAASTVMCPHLLYDQRSPLTPSSPLCAPMSAPSPPSAQPLTSSSSSSNRRNRSKNFLQNACKHPDTIVWSNTRKCVVKWNKEGKLGFTVLDVLGQDGSEVYAMVVAMKKDSPVTSSGLQVGDRVLSVNGIPIHQQQTKAVVGASKEIFKQQSRDNPVSIIIQRPERIREATNSSTSETSSLESVTSTGSSRDIFINGDAPMGRLPDLRLVIMGSNAENTAEQLVGAKIWADRLDGPISKRCCLKIQKRDCIFEYLSAKSTKVMDILKALETRRKCSVASSIGGLMTVPECVVLEVVVVKDSRFADYCSQLLMTSHCMYIVEFDGQSFLDNTEMQVRELQGQLNKIRTYAGSESPIYLLSTWQLLSAHSSDSTEVIGNQLQHRFGEAFGKQLQYHGNCPCFILGKGLPGQRRSSPQRIRNNQCHHQGGERVELTVSQDASDIVKFRTQSSTSTSSSSSSSVLSSMNSCSTCFSDYGPEACLTLLRDHISSCVFEQSFVPRKNYPQKFLSFRDIVMGLRDQKQKCVLTSGIKKACGITDSGELTSLLEYLHRQGVIILPANETEGPHCTFVALNPEDLVHTCERLLEVPEVSQQDPSYRQHWSNLKNRSVLTPALLTHILGMESDAACITVCLQQLNLIYDYSQFQSTYSSSDSPQTERRSSQQTYLLPFHRTRLVPRGTNHCRNRLSDRMLVADFKGYRPHGLFSKLAVELGRVADGKRGTCELESETSWVFNMGGNYTVYMRDDPNTCRVQFVIKCSVSYLLQNVLNDIRTAMMKVMLSDDGFTLGPPCPMDQRCKFQQECSGLFFPHIINLTKECGESPLWCGDEDVRKFQSVRQWIGSQGTQPRLSPRMNSTGRIIDGNTALADLPPDLIQLVCNKMNPVDPRGRDWKGLAGKLGYLYTDVKLFETASYQHQQYYDPCRHLLEDWGKSGDATLKNLFSTLKLPELNRMDVILEITDKWKVIDN